MNQSINLRSITFLSAALITLLGYNYMSAQVWTQAPANPPTSNTAAPINVGPTTQTKNGILGVNGLAVFGGATFTGWPGTDIQGTGPTTKYTDSDHRDFWTHVNIDGFYVIADRNENGNWDGEFPAPLQLYAGATPGEDYARFANQVRANQYCDANGANCSAPGGGGDAYAGYSWQELTSARSPGVVYQNTTGKSITVNFTRGAVDGFSTLFVSHEGNWVRASVCWRGNACSAVVVPAGESYYVNTGPVLMWSELRPVTSSIFSRAGRVEIYNVVRPGNPSINDAQSIYSDAASRSRVCEILSPGSSVISYTDEAFGGMAMFGTGIYSTGFYSGSSWQYRLYQGGSWGGTTPITPSDRYLTQITCE